MNTKRLCLELTPQREEELDTLQSKLGLTRKELLETSIDVISWIVKKKQEGKQFYAADPSAWNVPSYQICNFRGILFFEAAP